MQNGWKKNIKIPKDIADFTQGTHADLFSQAIQEGIDKANQEAEFRAAEVKKFCILPNEFSITGGEFGPTLKVKRHFVTEKYHGEIQSMYTT